jgi:hypothetical protein
MQTGLPPVKSIRTRMIDLAVRELDVTRREAALERAGGTPALPRVPADYFAPGHNPNEDSWWSLQLGRG